MKLHDNAISPFARKVRLVLEFKQLPCEFVDGLANKDALVKVNGRAEVPVLEDGDAIIAGSSDIVTYLDDRYGATPVMPEDPRMRAFARRWERCADTTLDALLYPVSLYRILWRDEEMPQAMDLAARTDLEAVYEALEQDLTGREFLCGEAISRADFAVFPHVAAAMSFRMSFSKERHPTVTAWMRRLLQQDLFQADLERVRAYIAGLDRDRAAAEPVVWRGDRLEWLLSRGFSDWLQGEIGRGRAAFPGIDVPAG